MTATAPPAGKSKATLSQWQLIWMNYRKHHLAHTSLYVLILFYLVAVFADVVAPYDDQRFDLQHLYCPPQVPAFDLSHGLYVHPVVMEQNPITFRREYYQDVQTFTPLRFLARSAPYYLWGLIPLEHKLLAVPYDPSETSGKRSFHFL